MNKPKDKILKKFVNHIENLEYTRKKMEELLLKKSIVYRDIEQVYMGIFMEVVTSFEKTIEELFLGLLSNQISSGKVHCRIKVNTQKIAREIVFSDNEFVSWLPYRKTEDILLCIETSNKFINSRGYSIECRNNPVN